MSGIRERSASATPAFALASAASAAARSWRCARAREQVFGRRVAQLRRRHASGQRRIDLEDGLGTAIPEQESERRLRLRELLARCIDRLVELELRRLRSRSVGLGHVARVPAQRDQVGGLCGRLRGLLRSANQRSSHDRLHPRLLHQRAQRAQGVLALESRGVERRLCDLGAQPPLPDHQVGEETLIGEAALPQCRRAAARNALVGVVVEGVPAPATDRGVGKSRGDGLVPLRGSHRCVRSQQVEAALLHPLQGGVE